MPEKRNSLSISKSKSISTSKSESESLLVGNAGQYQPIPIKIYYPEDSVILTPRRSTRFASLLQNDAAGFGLIMWDQKTPKRSSKRQNLVHATPLRRSPRLNSGPAGIAWTSLESGSGALTKSDSKTAKSCLGKLDPRHPDEMCLRRSPRFSSGAENTKTDSVVVADDVKWKRSRSQEIPSTGSCSNNLEDQNENLDGKCYDGKCFRRSLRLASTQSECKRIDPSTPPQKMLRSLEKGHLEPEFSSNLNLYSDAKPYPLPWKKGSNKRTVPFKPCHGKLSGEKSLRKSPRLHPSTREHGKEASVENCGEKLLGGMNFRRSPRFSSSSGNENLTKVLQERKSSKIVYQKTKHLNVNSGSIKLSKSSIGQPSKVTTPSVESSPSIPDAKGLICSSEIFASQFGIESGRANCHSFTLPEPDEKSPRKRFKTSVSSTNKSKNHDSISSFIGDPIPDDEAREQWGWRYNLKDKESKDSNFKINEDDEDEIVVNVKYHYAQAKIGNFIFSLGDCAFIKGEGEQKYVGKIVEFFQTTDRENYFRCQWFYKIEDTVVQDEGGFHDKKRLFYSSIMNDNLIDCIIAKASITHIKPRLGLKLTSIPPDFYYDMEYCVDYSTFRTIPTDNLVKSGMLSSPIVRETLPTVASTITKNNIPSSELHKTELALLDLYSGCGGMSTGLGLGAKVSSVNLVTRWAVDSDGSACESLKLNHPETYVRNESAEDFLELLKEWEKLCKRYKVNHSEGTLSTRSKSSDGAKKQLNSQADPTPEGEYEVSRLLEICYGDPRDTGNRGLYFKVRWKGYSASEDTWEPIDCLRKCQESIQDFVRDGRKSKILPLPGDVDVICGGPPCQGISGYNRFRNTESPLDDERNHQIVVFMDIVKFLKPKYVLMENVVDILRFDKGSLGRYALSRLVHMNYQARLGTVAAGCYGLPQFRLRVFLWGAHPSEVLPQFPLPTHEVIVRYWPPPEFERNTVAYDEDQPRELEKAILIKDAICDLPAVSNAEVREEMSYKHPPETEFQRYIRSTNYEMTGSTLNGKTEKRPLLYDHRPHLLFEDDYLRVCQIPKRKGANFRDLPGVVVGADNVVRRDPTENRRLPSGKPLVPDYCFTYEQGKSKRPFGRLWWDETVPTVLTSPSCHTKPVLHPEQDRVLTIREVARLQGFPDYYRFCGTVRERYCQIGNAVAVPVARALGYALGMAYRKLSGDEPLMTLPPKFSHSNYVQLSNYQLGKTE